MKESVVAYTNKNFKFQFVKVVNGLYLEHGAFWAEKFSPDMIKVRITVEEVKNGRGSKSVS